MAVSLVSIFDTAYILSKMRISCYPHRMNNDSQPIRHSIHQFNIVTTLLSVLNRNDPNDTDFVLARYLLDNIRRLPELSIYQVADDCFVSRSSVQRFIKTIGFESFTAMKDNVGEVTQHMQSFVQYTDHSDYRTYIKEQMGLMLENINAMAEEQDLGRIARRIHHARTCMMLSAEDSSGALHTFQQSMVLAGKLTRVVTNAPGNPDSLKKLTDEDMLITCSASGNYALAVNDDIRDVKGYKVLVTLNRTLIFEPLYDSIFYLSRDVMPSSRRISAIRNIYTQYGIQYFLDLLYHVYFSLYQSECISE